MKEGIGLKRLSVLFLILTMVLAGCGAGEPTAVTANHSFCCSVSVEQNGLQFEADLTAAPEQCAAVFSCPEEIKDMAFVCRNGRVTVRRGEQQTETSLPEPKQCFLYWLDQALSQTNASVIRKENALLSRGAAQGRNYLLTLDKATLRPLYFEIDSLDLSVKFQSRE